jgi:16S rRNA (adenine1518-N6/adenine1519-N6)-dimethyltransferase
MKHIARKRFGQHFLTDGAIIESIVQAIAPKPGQRVVEIGPGLAALTQPLVERLGHLTVIELDRDLAQRLRSHGHLTVIESDVLKVDFSQVNSAWSAPDLGASGGAPADREPASNADSFSSARRGGCDRRPALHAAKGSD